ncbi:hypothetical protein [Natronolimnohabitans innermongolicus]|nr:hypothetical protein [Natronolimnohabitans innermongolicus]
MTSSWGVLFERASEHDVALEDVRETTATLEADEPAETGAENDA